MTNQDVICNIHMKGQQICVNMRNRWRVETVCVCPSWRAYRIRNFPSILSYNCVCEII